MSLSLQMGDFATRLARSMGVRGSTPLSLDQIIQPTARMVDLDKEPFRDYPIVSMYPAEGGPGAGQFGSVKITSSAVNIVVVRRIQVHVHTTASAMFLNLQRNQDFTGWPPVSGLGTSTQPSIINQPNPLNATGNTKRATYRVLEEVLPAKTVIGDGLYTAECDPDVPWEFIHPENPIVLFQAVPYTAQAGHFVGDVLQVISNTAGIPFNVNIVAEEYPVL